MFIWRQGFPAGCLLIWSLKLVNRETEAYITDLPTNASLKRRAGIPSIWRMLTHSLVKPSAVLLALFVDYKLLDILRVPFFTSPSSTLLLDFLSMSSPVITHSRFTFSKKQKSMQIVFSSILPIEVTMTFGWVFLKGRGSLLQFNEGLMMIKHRWEKFHHIQLRPYTEAQWSIYTRSEHRLCANLIRKWLARRASPVY